VRWAWSSDWGWKSPVDPNGGNHEVKATARDGVWTLDNRSLSREGVWGGSRSRTAAPNASEPSNGLLGPGLACLPSQRPISVGGRGVVRAEAAGHCSILPQEISVGPHVGRPEEGNDDRLMPAEKSDRPIVVLKPGNAGGAKGATSC